MIEVRNAGVKGLGIFATATIPRGTRVLAEKAIIKVKNERGVFAASRRLDKKDEQKLLRLSIHPVRKSALLTWTQAAWHALLPERSGDTKSTSTVAPFWTCLLKYPTFLEVFRNNNFDIGKGDQAIFNEICRLNHACVPNCQGNYNQELDAFTIHAVKPIQENEELTISYLSEHGALKESRQGRLRQQYGFLCDCPACDTATKRGKAGQERRIHLQELLHTVAEDAERQGGPSLEAELGMTMRLIEVYESEGIAGRELATMYLTAAETALKLRRPEEVRRLAESGLELDRDCLGEDSDLLQQTKERVRVLLTAVG
ncbi:hypothetical protein DOTSEDRAFT_52689 [Dothistroma septosporum NZE10]|uniref:SET domain-containing protein n=1 Tax=Dothistroma septosporum (strain NZE10 / CBS 128990) TaxID=675120 RepID=N1PSK6_DOTSN|nr:hypothetical protein DOTSEDRAFT_52689 [Dothistroma septosporum NZE10]